MIKKLKKAYDKLSPKQIEKVLLFIVLANIILDLDNAVYVLLNNYSLPRPSTIFKFIIIPLLMLLLFCKLEKNKKKVIIIGASYLAILGIYFVIHCKIAADAVPKLYLTNNFYFSIKDEFFNVFTLVIPFGFIYLTYKADLSEDTLESIVFYASAIVSVSIVISDLFEFGYSTYGGKTAGNIFTWFFEDLGERPQYYTSKFFFEEGNTIGILLFGILPLMYFFLYKYRDNKKVFIKYIVFIVIQSLAMYMLGTRVSTFGCFLIPIMMALMLVVLSVLKKEQFSVKFIIVAMVISIALVSFYKVTPAYQNQVVYRESDSRLKHAIDDNSDLLNSTWDGIKQLMNDDVVFHYALIYQFEEFSWLINSTPKQYYMDYYNYKFDPGFWLSYIFEIPFEQRQNARQTELIFNMYKWNGKAETKEHIMGMGYSTFMFGSIIVEQDFVRQFLSYGYVGSLLICGPWIGVLLYVVLKTILSYKEKWDMCNITCLASVCMLLLCGYLSAHTIDQYITSFFCALLCGFLIKTLSKKKETI